MANHVIIAIDGHSSSGKSTLAKDLARKLSYIFIDTGAMYRAVTYYFLQHDIDLDDSQAIEKALRDIDIHFEIIAGKNICFLNGENVEDEIRSLKVSNHVSHVARIEAVRNKLVQMQRKMGEYSDIVMDGRDIGTVVFPDANLKLYVTADIDERARRRYTEMVNKGIKIAFKEVLDNLKERDRIDTTRSIAPLKRADDAYLIDNTHIGKVEQLELALNYLNNINTD